MPEVRSARARLGAAVDRRIALLAPARRLRLALALHSAERHAGGRPIRVLDAGCGDGLLTVAIARRHSSWSLIGMDLDEELLTVARAHARARRLDNVRFERADLTEPLSEDGFDVVLAIECLEEIPEDGRTLEMLAAAVAPGGILVVHAPERTWRPILPGSASIWRHEVRHGYTADGILRMLGEAGLSPVEVRPTLRGTVVVAQELRDRIKGRSVAVRTLAFPALAAAVRLERIRLTWGPGHALFAIARRDRTR